MSAIEFVVRDRAGYVQRGSVAGQGGVTAIAATPGADISLNLSQADIMAYERNGSALRVVLQDGRVIVIEGYFGADGAEVADLFISTNGQLTEVNLVGAVDGSTVYATYVSDDVFGKWGPNDDLLFYDSALAGVPTYEQLDGVGMLALGPLAGLGVLPLLGLGAATAAVLGGGEDRDKDDDGKGGDGPTGSILDGTIESGHVVNAEDRADGVDISGTATPGTTVRVEIGEAWQETRTNEDGTWTVTFPAEDIPEGTYETPVTAIITDEDGDSITLDETLGVDTEASVTFDEDAVGGDGTVNATEAAGGVLLTGTTEAGSTVVVTINGQDYTATVTGTDWSLVVPAADVAPGEYLQGVTVTATDQYGNTATTTGDYIVDTETSVSIRSADIGGDGTVNATEHAAGTVVTGRAEAGASVVVTIGEVSHTVTADGNGRWSAEFSAAELATGTYMATVTAVATDAAGNTATATGRFRVDTETSVTLNEADIGGNGVVNASEHAGGVEITGTAEAGARVIVEIGGVIHRTVATAEGTWSVTYAVGDLQPGTYDAVINVRAVDAAGNVATTSGNVRIDTEAAVAFDPVPVTADNVVNAAEAAGPITLTGTTEPGSAVVVVVAGLSLNATVAANGAWSVTLPAGTITGGVGSFTATATATDAEGNTASATREIAYDTETFVTVETATVETDGVVNFVERSDGVTLTGTGEAGATVEVTMNGFTRSVTVAADGRWSADFAASEVPEGELTQAVSVTATDAAGNAASAGGTITIDTYVNTLTLTARPGGADQVVNERESGQPLTLGGMVEPGSTVVVTLHGVRADATVAADGSWTVTYPAGALPSGEYDATIVIAATDRAGNTAEITDTLRVDTVAGDVALDPGPIEGDDIVNHAELQDGVLIRGTATPGLTVTVTLGGVAHQVVAAPDGTWSSLYLRSEVPEGTYDATITASITDAAGNFKEVSDTVRIDTEVVPFTLSQPIEGDNVVNRIEASDGVSITGTVEAGSSVVVRFGSLSQRVDADAAGNWIATFPAASLPSGEMDMPVVAIATDPAGNTSRLTADVHLDTIVNRLTMNVVEGDDLVNRAEASDGVVLSGLVEVGSTVVVTIEAQGTTITRNASVDASGRWTVDLAPGVLPAGEYEADVRIMATDRHGNTRPLQETFIVDTTPPDAPLIASYTRAGAGVRALTTELTDEAVEIHAINGAGQVTQPAYTVSEDPAFGELRFAFASPVPNGSHLVMTAGDASGNTTSTLFVLEETGTNTVPVGNTGLGRFDIEAIDLQFAEDSVLTLSPADLARLSAHSDRLTIHGGADDVVNVAGAQETGRTEEIGGRTYNVYSFGDTGSLIIDEAITVNT